MSIRPAALVIKQRHEAVALLQSVETDTRPRREVIAAKLLIVHLKPASRQYQPARK